MAHHQTIRINVTSGPETKGLIFSDELIGKVYPDLNDVQRVERVISWLRRSVVDSLTEARVDPDWIRDYVEANTTVVD